MAIHTESRVPVKLRRALGLPSVVFFGLAYMIPLTVFTTFGVVNVLTHGHIVSSYFVTLGAMLFTALSYGKMARAFPVAGSAYAYTRRTLGGHVGFMSGWALMLDYILMPMITYLVIGIYLHEAIPAVPQWVWIIASLLLVTGLNVLGIKFVSKVSSSLLVFQTVFLAVFAVMAVFSIQGRPLPSIVEVLFGLGPGLSTIFAGAAILCLSFLGFDAVSTLAEETRNARKVIPQAILLVTLIGGTLFILLSAISVLVIPDWTNYTDVASATLDVMKAAGGEFLAIFFTAAYVAGCLGAVMASQTTVSRILYSMGRDGVLPKKVFGYLHPSFRTPIGAIVVVGLVGTTALLIPLATASSLISFGALVAFSVVNLAVIKHYYLDQKRRSARSALSYLLAPLIGVLLCLWLWTSLSGTAFVFGSIWLGVGLIQLVSLTRGFRQQPPELSMVKG